MQQGESAGPASANDDEADVAGVSAEHLEAMERQQPGADGARISRRAERAYYNFKGEQNGPVQRVLCDILIKLFHAKTVHNGSAELVTDKLLIFSESKAVAEDVRANMPQSFKAMLAALHDFGFPENDLWEYDMCPCGQLYR